MTGTEDMTGVADTMTGVKDTTGAEKAVEATKNGIRSEGGRRSRDPYHEKGGTPVQ